MDIVSIVLLGFSVTRIFSTRTTGIPAAIVPVTEFFSPSPSLNQLATRVLNTQGPLGFKLKESDFIFSRVLVEIFSSKIILNKCLHHIKHVEDKREIIFTSWSILSLDFVKEGEIFSSSTWLHSTSSSRTKIIKIKEPKLSKLLRDKAYHHP